MNAVKENLHLRALQSIPENACGAIALARQVLFKSRLNCSSAGYYLWAEHVAFLKFDRIFKARILVTGKVQGVYFRDTTKRKANELSLTVAAYNLKNKKVKIVAEGKGQY